jgi:formylglycine-generating enzyme required for sulfatase activity
MTLSRISKGLTVTAVVAAGFLFDADAAVVSQYGIDFCVVGSAGNRAPNAAEMPTSPGNRKPGTVGYEYSIAKTELTSGQWLEFVRAYASFNPETSGSTALTGDYIVPTNMPSGRTFDLIHPSLANRATNMSWRMAARYCNWLTNGKAMTADAFEHGAYDTSTFGKNAQGHFTDQLTRSAGAKFWIPNLDEWVKATYFDPNRYGEGQEGYWKYSGKSDSQLPFGRPEDGGKTNAGSFEWGVDQFPVDVGAYSLVTSPWGLLDTCGGTSEWLEGTLYPDRPHTGVMDIGARIGNLDEQVVFYDRLAWPFSNTSPESSGPGGLRIAMFVPSVSTGIPFLICGALMRRKRQ